MADTVIQHKWKVKYSSLYIRNHVAGHFKFGEVEAPNLEMAKERALAACPDGFQLEAIARNDVNEFFPCKGKSAIKKEENSNSLGSSDSSP